jgi:hypothetical protein
VPQAETMRIIVDIYLDEDGRPAGTVRAEDRGDTRSFAGNLEFLALIESLYRVDEQSCNPRGVSSGETCDR